jgi:predicted  nucleic acid-binding Zn-ribbon protein
MNPIQADKLRKRVSELESAITKLEGRNEKLQAKLGAASAFEEQSTLLGEMETCSKKIADLEREWEELNVKLEAEA